MRELQDKCKSLENIIENLKREMEESLDKCKSLENIKENLERELREIQEALEEGWEEEEVCLEKKASATPGWISSSVSQVSSSVSQVIGFFVKDKTQELARVKAELAASQKKNDDLKKCKLELLQEQKNICDTRETAQKEMQAQLTAKDADLALQHSNVQRLEAELALVQVELAAAQKKVVLQVDDLKTSMQEQKNICDAGETAQKEVQAQLTAKDAKLALQHVNVQSLEANVQRLEAEAVALDNICNAKESELKEIKSGLARQGLDKSVHTAVSSEDAHAEDRVASIIMNDMLDAENATQQPTAKRVNKINRVSAATAQAQHCELPEIRLKLSAQAKLFEACERDLKASKQTYDNTYQAQMDLEVLEDADLPDTVSRAEQARRSVFFLHYFLFYGGKHRC
jgi:hypothetical protein